MSEAVCETECTHCSHREVCSLKSEYLELVTTHNRCDEHFTVTTRCKHFYEEARIRG